MNKLYEIGQWIMVVGSLIYAVALIVGENKTFTAALCVIYGISLILMLIGKLQQRKEKAEK